MSLTPKQERFCLAYLETGNASEAYRRSYSAENMSQSVIHNKASALLAKGEVRVRLEELNKAAVSSAVMSRQEAMERLSTFARTDLADLVEFGSYELGEDDSGNPIIQAAWKIRDSVLQDPAKLAAIAELSATKDGVKIKTHSPLQAIQQLAKMQGWDRPDLELDLKAKRLAVEKLRRELDGEDEGPAPQRVEVIVRDARKPDAEP
ncbi:terminase small subunit [Azotobacter beijerinckii]|uniref:Phage terminase small subunit n=1 Tax=Azotobacter beijerinckii TaxID=170623 RepID=A0A1I0Z181_9GAMM|nr:terminase small subunit [Azotobacter beijerinckii]SFB19385.1 phage terminase small subunit [Azotobacter beijerinckii]